MQHANGLLYGTTENDPEGQQFGTVFRMTLEGRVKILHRFSGTDGARPFGLVAGPDGALYGVARQAGPTSFGTVYRIDTRGNFSVLHAFESFVSPVGRLAFGPDGRLYGVTQFGPTQPYGSVYALTPARLCLNQAAEHLQCLAGLLGERLPHPRRRKRSKRALLVNMAPGDTRMPCASAARNRVSDDTPGGSSSHSTKPPAGAVRRVPSGKCASMARTHSSRWRCSVERSRPGGGRTRRPA